MKILTVGRNTCPSIDELDALLADTLCLDDSEGLAAHVDACPTCQDALERLTEISDEPANRTTVTIARPNSEIDDAGISNLDRERSPQLVELLNQMKSAGLPASLEAVRKSGFESAERIRFPIGPSPDAPLGELGHYRILEAIGHGASGRLFRARDTRLGRDVAIKVLRSELAVLESARTRFDREGRAVALLDDEHIVTIYDVDSPDDFLPYIVMELVEGESLAQRIQRVHIHDPESAASLVTAILKGLEVAHAAGVVHRDVKPGNVLIQNDGRVKLADFGLARLDDQPIDLTSQCLIAGTPAYMSPEQVLEPANVDGRCDVYSAGVVLFELLTGEVPFQGVPRMVLHQVVHEDPRSPRKFNDRIPRDLETICLKALTRELSRRYQSAAEFRADLECWQEGRPILARPVGTIEKIWRWRQRNPTVSTLVTVATILLLGLMGTWLRYTVSIANNNERLADANRALHDFKDKAAAGEIAATQNAKLAERQANVAFELINEVVFEMQNELARLPESAEIRKSILSRAVVRLDELSQSLVNSPAPQLSLIVARNRLGDTFRELDQPADALREYRRALLVADRLLAENPSLPAAIHCRIQTRLNLGESLLNHNLREARDQFVLAESEAKRLLASDSSNSPLKLQAEESLSRAQARVMEIERINGHTD